MAVTGDGDFPLRSAWLGRGRGRGRGANPRKFVNVAVTDANRDIWQDWAFEAAVAGGAISGAVSVAFTTSGAIAGTGALTGSSAPAFTTAGILRGSGVLSGSTSGTFTTSATGLAVGALSGSASVAFAPAGAIGGTGALAGSSSSAFTLSGTLQVPSGEMSGSASFAFDVSGTGEVSGGAQNLHGRKPRRGRIVKFADELPPEVIETPKIEPLPSLETIRAKVAEAKQALEAVQIAQIRAKEREATAKALNALSERYDATLAALQQAEANERAWIRRLHDEDDFFLLAA